LSYLEDFREGLERAKRILKLDIPIETAMIIEKNQIDIINYLLPKAKEYVKGDRDLKDLVSEALDDIIKKFYYVFAKDLEVKDDVESPEEALNNLLSGRTDLNGSKILILIIQAIARAYATAYEELKGTIERRSTVCPICGMNSDVIIKWPDGSYRMICPFCGYTWIISKETLLCPRCGSRDPVGIGVFSDREGKIGLFVCQDCKFTAKIILDSSLVRKVPRMLLPLIALYGERFRSFLKEL
jgi:transposase-like protein